ncbi:putative exonuclease [Aspergillus candidus]|uniref:Putative exonuclease n=1 Tax=Aspergillus candidus TaxID=41067 RepID=A0A2I2EXT2_ASPCN|nr:putative exonuclease [Aspergillus candidus]PLB33171.1 putative exonuclease [Aspergillus candidus]
MGIKGLHGLLKSIQKPCHLKKFSGQALGVDAYGWLHRGTVACAVDLVLDKPTTKHIDFVLNRVRMLLYFGVIPYLVFDGDDLPSKAGTECDRQQRRQQSKALGLELQRKGRIAEAYQELQKAVDVTPLMARQLIEELKKLNVQYVVAPYEADAQLVYLERQGVISGIISEDSDMLVFGARRLLSKLDQHGDCIEINRADFTACREISLIGWTDADFRRMCILSGCDYLANIPKLGLKTAYRSIRKYKNVEKALRALQFESQYHVPTDYLQNFRQAELTFLYQRVFCPNAAKLVTLTAPADNINLDELPYIGADMDPEIARGVSSGELHPTTKEPLVLKTLLPSKLAERKLAMGVNRRQTLGSSAELKPNKPISSFFTPKRTPLAELDPNTMSPSPSQQRLLQRHANSSWDSTPASTGLGVPRSAPSMAQSRRVSSPLVRSVERNNFLAQTSQATSLQSVKRQRLCSETEDKAQTDRVGSRSRFFGDEVSPSGQKVTRTKKARKSTLDVFADDMAEDIMSQIPDPSQASIESKGAPSSDPEKFNSQSPGNLQDSKALEEQEDAAETPGEQQDTVIPPKESVSIDSNPKLFHQVLDYHVEKQNSSLLSKYTFQPRGKQGSDRASKRKDSHTPGPRSMTPTGPRGPAAGGSGPSPRLTPLQRLGHNALARSHSLNSLPPRAADTPLTSSKTVDQPVQSQGSEDMIIPDSEDEPDEDDGGEREPIAFDLKRFSFTSK